MSHFVVSTSKLEAKDWLQVFTFKKNIAFKTIALICCMSQRGFFDNFIDFGSQNETEVLGKGLAYEDKQTAWVGRTYIWSTIWQKKGIWNWVALLRDSLVRRGGIDSIFSQGKVVVNWGSWRGSSGMKAI